MLFAVYYNSTNVTKGWLQVSAFANLPPPNGSCTTQGGGGIADVTHTTNGAIGIALFSGLANAQKGAAVDVYYLQERNVVFCIYPIECAIGIEAIETSVFADSASLVGGMVRIIHNIELISCL